VDAPKKRKETGPEADIQRRLIAYLSNLGWHIMVTHGNLYQQGFPDLLALHPAYGYRWIEVKFGPRHTFTPAQRFWFPLMAAAGMAVHILVEATEDEYKKLFDAPNWHMYMYFKHGA